MAAITIPGIINNYRRKELHTAFLRSVSIFKNAINTSIYEYGVYNIEKISPDEFNNEFLPILMGKLQVVKTFEIRKLDSPYNIDNYTKTFGANTCFSTDRWNNKSQSYLLKDGQHICFRYLDGWENVWYAMGIDTNGFKGPNRYGYDVFEFKITDSLYPYQIGDGHYCAYSGGFVNHQSNGRHCAFYALKDVNREDTSKGYWDSLKF